jgi:hypothetical protein
VDDTKFTTPVLVLTKFNPNVEANVPAAAPGPKTGVGFAATGGEIGGPTIVGENGPELFIPSGRGNVIPNNKLSDSLNPSAQPSVVYNGPYIENMSAIDTQSAAQFLAKNKMGVWSANQSANRSIPVNR